MNMPIDNKVRILNIWDDWIDSFLKKYHVKSLPEHSDDYTNRTYR